MDKEALYKQTQELKKDMNSLKESNQMLKVRLQRNESQYDSL